jgi:hypothetical protein
LPPRPYVPATWKRATVYRDGYVTFEGAYYSVPYRLVGQSLWLRGAARTVELYTERHELVATHDRAQTPGERLTHLAHLPPEKVAGLTLSRQGARAHAVAIGPATAALVDALLEHRPEDRLRSAGRLLRLAATTTPARLERACARAQVFGAADYSAVKRILAANQEEGAEPVEALVAPAGRAASAASGPPPRAYTFMRQASEFVSGLFAGVGIGGGGGGGTGGNP